MKNISMIHKKINAVIGWLESQKVNAFSSWKTAVKAQKITL